MLLSMTGVILAITQLKAHWHINADAMTKERTWLGCDIKLATLQASEMLGQGYTYTCLRSKDEWDWTPSYTVEDNKQVH